MPWRCLNAEARDDIRTADFSQESDPKFNEGKPVSLGLREVCESLISHQFWVKAKGFGHQSAQRTSCHTLCTEDYNNA